MLLSCLSDIFAYCLRFVLFVLPSSPAPRACAPANGNNQYCKSYAIPQYRRPRACITPSGDAANQPRTADSPLPETIPKPCAAKMRRHIAKHGRQLHSKRSNTQNLPCPRLRQARLFGREVEFFYSVPVSGARQIGRRCAIMTQIVPLKSKGRG